MNDDLEKRLEEARKIGEREKQTREFLESLTKDDEIVRPIYNPEAFVMREKAIGAAGRGEIKRTDCRHPLEYLQQYVDDDPAVGRYGKALNLFECGVCHIPIWYVDPWGVPLADA